MAITGLPGVVGSLFTTPAIPTWYATLKKPALTPPNAVFGPVWTTLYVLMGVAAFLVWRRGWGEPAVRRAAAAFVIQVILNAAWSAIFFGAHAPGWAFAEIIALWVTILITIFLFRKVSVAAAWLMVPYILWVSFASFLNLQVWLLNR